jgi:hypothetical protein
MFFFLKKEIDLTLDCQRGNHFTWDLGWTLMNVYDFFSRKMTHQGFSRTAKNKINRNEKKHF